MITIRHTINPYRRSFCAANCSTSQFGRYLLLRNSKEIDVYRRIADRCLPTSLHSQFLVSKNPLSPSNLQVLSNHLTRTSTHPMISLPGHKLALTDHFESIKNFYNLMFGTCVSKWTDRKFLQNALENDFRSLIPDRSMVVVTGSSDGQFPVTIQGLGAKYGIDIHQGALRLAQATHQAFDLEEENMHWVHADATHPTFLRWLGGG